MAMILALISKIFALSIAIVATSISSEILLQRLTIACVAGVDSAPDPDLEIRGGPVIQTLR